VLEYLLGMYCATDNEESINDGVQRVKSILADNFVRPDEAEKIKSKIREILTYTVIDKVEAKLDPDSDNYKAIFSNLNIKNVIVSDDCIKKYEKLLAGGIWCIIRMNYNRLEARYDDFDTDEPKGSKKNKIDIVKINCILIYMVIPPLKL
jgi:ATP-dependent Lon protease